MNCIDVNHKEVLDLHKLLNIPKIVIAAKISLWQEDNKKSENDFPTKEELLGNVEPTVELNVVDNSKRAIYLGIKKLNLTTPYDILNHLINIANTIVAAEDQEVGVFEVDGKEILKFYNENLQIESIEINKKDSALDVTKKLDKIYLSRMDNYAKEEESKKKEEIKPQALTAKERIAAAKAKKDNPNKDTAFKTDSNIELNESINDEIKTLVRILPKDIAVDLSDSYLQVLANGRVAGGYFKNGMIHLTNYGNKGVAFHEAFHAVFRSSLSNEERSKIYEEAKLNYIRPTKADVKNLMLQNNIDANEATKLYYEELLADEFAAFLNNPEAHEYYEEYPKGILGFFKTLLKWIKNIFASNKRTKGLFNSINAGNFVDRVSNKNNNIAYSTVKLDQIVASEKTIRELTARMADRIGINFRFESDRTKDYKGKLENFAETVDYSNGFADRYKTNQLTAVINLAHATLDTPIHEILAHPIIRAIKNNYSIVNDSVILNSNEITIPNNLTSFYSNLSGRFEKRDGVWKRVILGLNSEELLDVGEEKLKLFYISSDEYKKNPQYKVEQRTEPSKLYNNLLNSLETGTGKEVLDRIKRDYKTKFESIDHDLLYELTKDGFELNGTKWISDYRTSDEDGESYVVYTANGRYIDLFDYNDALNNFAQLNAIDKEYSLQEQQEEALVELLGLMTANKLDAIKDKSLIGFLKEILKELSNFIRMMLREREIEIAKLPDNLTIGELSDLLAYSNSKLILPGYEVEYTTPDNVKHKTYLEASLHIGELAKAVEDVDVSNVSIDNKYPKYFEEINYPFDDDPYTVRIFKQEGGKYYISHDSGFTPYKRKVAYDQETGKVLFGEVSKEEYESTIDNISNKSNSSGRFNTPDTIKEFIDKNKTYEQAKEVIDEWKKVNNIVYNPEEIYSRGQEFVSVVGAYASFDVNLMMQNLLHHIEDNHKAGGEFTISAFTKPIDKKLRHIEGDGGKIRFKIYPQSNDIKWAANKDVNSGSVWDAAAKISKNKQSELLGVTYSKYPAIDNVSEISPNLADIVDNISHSHNELGISLNGTNFRLEYDSDIPNATKKIIDGINNILDQRYGKLVKPEIKKTNEGRQWVALDDADNTLVREFNNKEDAETWINENKDDASDHGVYLILGSIYTTGIQPTITNTTLKKSISDFKNLIGKTDLNDSNYDTLEVKDYFDFNDGDYITGFVINNYGDSSALESLVRNEPIFDTKEEAVTRLKEVEKKVEQLLKESKENAKKEYNSQALINTKVAALKEVAKQQPRTLIRSEVKKISSNQYQQQLFEDDEELPFQKVSRNLNKLPQFTNGEVREITKQLAFMALHNNKGELLPIDQIDLNSMEDQVLTYIYKYSDEETELFNEELALRFTEVYENIEFFKDKIDKYLKSLKIQTAEDDLNEDEDSGNVVPYNNYEVSDKVSATDSTKLLVALTPNHTFDKDGRIVYDTEGSYLGLPQFANYNDTWNIMKTKLQGIVSIIRDGVLVDPFDTMIEELKEAGKYRPNLIYIANKLENASDKVQTEFFVTFSSMRMNYVDHLKSGEHGNMTSKITTSDTAGKESLIFENWANEFSKKLGVLKGNAHQYTYDATKIEEALKKFSLFKIAANTNAGEAEILGAVNKALLAIGVDMKPLALKQVIDDLTPYGGTFNEGSKALLKQLGDALGKLKNSSGVITKNNNYILSQKSVFKELLAKTQSTFVTQSGDQQVPGPEGNKKCIYQNNNSISKRLAQMKLGDKTFLHLLRNPDPKKSSVYHGNSLWLNYIMDEENNGENTRDRLNAIRLTAYNNYKFEGQGDQGDKASDLKLPDQFDDVINKYLSGYFIGLAEADKAQQQYFTGLPSFKSQFGLNSNNEIAPLVKNGNVVNILRGYLIDELKRMTVAYEHLNSTDPNIKLAEEDQVIYYHYKDKPGDGKGNWKRSYIFPSMDLVKFDLIDEHGKPKELTDARIRNNSELNKYIENEFLKMLKNDVQEALANGIISNDGSGYQNETLSTEFFQSEDNPKGYNNVIEAISDYTFNSIISNVEQVKLFNGDPAFYKFKGDEFGDFRKRIPAALASGKDFRIYTDNNEEFIVRDHYVSATIEEIYKPSTYFTNPENIKRIAEKYKISEDEVKRRFKAYNKVDTTDAQAWITLDTYRERMLGLGKWTDDMQSSYNIINTGGILPIEKIGMFAQPLKTVHFELVNHKGLLVPTYNKQSEAVLLPQMVMGQPMQQLLDAMIEQKIDHVIVIEGRKAGAKNLAKVLDENGEIMHSSKIKLVGTNLSYNNLFLQQDLPTKETHDTQVASQIQKNVLLLVNAMRHYKNNKSGDQMVQEYHNIKAALSDIGVTELHEDIGWNNETKQLNLDTFYDSLIDEFEGDVSDNIIDGFLMQLPLDAFPQLRKKIENKTNAKVTKKTVKLKQSGGAFIMLSSFGFVGKAIDQSAKVGNGVIWIKDFGKELSPMRVGEKSTIEKAQILIPHTLITDIFAEMGINYRDKTSEELAKLIDPKILEGISYRIPNQGSSSNDAFEIVGILPPEMGDTMIAFNEITTKTGSDFDIDKAYVILPNFEAIFDNIAIQREFADNAPEGLKGAFNMQDITLLQEKVKDKIPISDIAQQLLDYYNKDYLNLKKKYFTGLGYVKYDPKNPTKKGLQNRQLEIMNEFMMHPDVFFNIMAPLDDDSIIKDFILKLFPEEKAKGDLWFWTGTNQMKTKSTFDNAKSLVGAIANHMVHHPLTMLDNVKYNSMYFTEDGLMTNKQVSVDKSQAYSNGEEKSVEAALGAFMNAIVDAAKDPYISRANINHFTASVAFMLTREGINPQKVIALMAQPILRDLVELTSQMEGRISKKERHTSGPMAGKIIKPLDRVLEKYGYDKATSNFKQFFTKDLHEVTRTNANNGTNTIAQLSEMIHYEKEQVYFDANGNKQYLTKDDFYNTKQLLILYKFLQWQNRAKSLNKLIKASRADTIGATKNINAAFIRNKGTEEILTPDKDGNTAFINADVMLGASIIEGQLVFDKSRFISACHENSVNESLRLAKGLYMNATPAMRQAVDSIALKAGYIFLQDELLADAITEELYAAIASRFPGITLDYEELNILISTLSHRLLEAKKNPLFADNDFIQGLDMQPGFGTAPDVIVFNSRGLDPDAKNDLYTAWEEVIDIDKQLGEDFIRYSFFASGFRQSFGAYYEHIPTSWLKDNGFGEYIAEEMSKMDNADYLKSMETEVFQHSVTNNKLVTNLSKGTFKRLFKGDIIELDPTKSEEYIYSMKEGVPKFKNYVKEAIPVYARDEFDQETDTILKTKYKLYELVGVVSNGEKSDSVTAYYKRINHFGISYKGVNLRENGTFSTSIFKDNEFTQTINIDEFIKNTNIQSQDNSFSVEEYIIERENITEEEEDNRRDICKGQLSLF